jgi:TonB family protein
MIAILLAAEVATACTEPVKPPVLKAIPSMATMLENYPTRAKRWGMGGLATVRCEVDATGVPQTCKAIEAKPIDQGFGEAAERVLLQSKFSPARACGQAVAGVAEKKIVFIPQFSH